MDMTMVSGILGNIKTATEIAKLIKDTDLTLEKAETKLKLADLISALADARIEVVNVQEALSQAEERIKALQKELEIKGDLTWKEPLYWLQRPDGNEGPFCQHCYDTGHKLIRLLAYGSGWYRCTACDNNYDASGTRSVQRGGAISYDPYEGF